MADSDTTGTTTYVIFKYDESGLVEELGEETVAARSRASKAIERFLDRFGGGPNPDSHGVYVAVRKDEWRPERVSVVTQTSLLLTPVADE